MHLKVSASPTCEQKWRYHIARWIVVTHFQAQQELVSAFEKRALQVYDFVNYANIASGLIHNVLQPDDSLRLFHAIYGGSGAALNLVPIDSISSGTAGELGRDLVNLIRESIRATIDYHVTGAAGSPDEK